MSAQPRRQVETRPSQNQAESSSSGATGWSENPWEEVPTIATNPRRGPKVVEYCNKPGQFWPDGQEPSFNGQKHHKRVFVTTGKCQSHKEITGNVREINCLKEEVRTAQTFEPRTGDIVLYHDYSDYEGTDEDDFFESLDDEDIIHPTLPPPIPDPPALDNTSIPSMIVNVPCTKWMDGSKTLDPDDLQLLSDIMDIPAAVYYKILPSSDSIVADFLKFKLPDLDNTNFTQDPQSSFTRALAVPKLRIPALIPPKAWVRSLRGALNTAIRNGK
ncbi:hypothetical protein CY34DRAFT_14555 [Suillus luteus UH-Slu-Lm8-n1]|uniref:Uncharacterized protein n=1 Tax=Suillus luteus UH-Slu-Lm8-n1 TaxID=930992 RepID=A0A0D0AM78_9AGAM|nr:hypothetical protein CY34DRAFT_14555 [Suillus luteus UH-Slu-Lm8-n1]